MESDFPLWLRASHLINFVLIGMLLRSGWEILASLPRLWWSNDSAPGKEWLKFTKTELPKEEGVYTSLMDEKSAHPIFTLPGRKNVGLGRHWHALSSSLWLLNGIVYVVLLFATGLWRRIIPTSLDIFPEAWDSFKIYAGLGVPSIEHYQPYDALQMLAYTGVIFILAPIMFFTGIGMSPAVRSRFPGYIKFWGGFQWLRSIHFISMVLISGFILMHVGLVFLVHRDYNLVHMVFGDTVGAGGPDPARVAQAFVIMVAVIVLVFLFWIGLSYWTLANRVKAHSFLVSATEPIRKYGLGWMKPQLSKQTAYTDDDLSEFHWTNGLPPTEDESVEWLEHRENNWDTWRLEVGGYGIDEPRSFTLDELKALPRHSYVGIHTCMQGWSATSRWTGVRLEDLLKELGPRPEGANYVMISSHGLAQKMFDNRPREPFYAVIDVATMQEEDTILAYERNGRPLDEHLGAPLRLRVESSHGYKMVKWVRSVEWLHDYTTVGDGRGGTREDSALQAFNGRI